MRIQTKIVFILLMTIALFDGRFHIAQPVKTNTVAYIIQERVEYKSLCFEESNDSINTYTSKSISETPVIIVMETVFTVQPIDSDFDVLHPSGYSLEQLESSLSSGNYRNLLPYAETIFEAEQTYGVNALFLLSLLGLESGWGQYTSGVNNIAGWTGDGGKYRDFDSIDDCINYVALNVSDTYRITVGSRLEDVCYRYCQNDGYFETLIQIMKERQIAMKGEIKCGVVN